MIFTIVIGILTAWFVLANLEFFVWAALISGGLFGAFMLYVLAVT